MSWNAQAIVAVAIGSALTALALWLVGWQGAALFLAGEFVGVMWQMSQTDKAPR